jgi:nicotinamide-nucleotide adenylyltransferase
MMKLLSQKIESTSSASALIALSKHPRFVDKARDISKVFPDMNTMVWLVGYDTLIRILDKKYYQNSLERELGRFWKRNRLVCAIRGDDVSERAYVERIKKGEVEGVPAAWGEYVTVIEPVGKEHSSTKARKAAVESRWEELDKVVPMEIAEYIRMENLYKEE